MSGFDRNLHFGSGSCQMKLEAVSSLGYETLSGTFFFFLLSSFSVHGFTTAVLQPLNW